MFSRKCATVIVERVGGMPRANIQYCCRARRTIRHSVPIYYTRSVRIFIFFYPSSIFIFRAGEVRVRPDVWNLAPNLAVGAPVGLPIHLLVQQMNRCVDYTIKTVAFAILSNVRHD